LICILLILFAMIPITANLVLKPYQQARLTAFAHPEIDKRGSSWAINQSLIAHRSGGWSGKGFKAANTQIELGFLPRRPCTTTTSFPQSASNGALSAECFSSAPLPCYF